MLRDEKAAGFSRMRRVIAALAVALASVLAVSGLVLAGDHLIAGGANGDDLAGTDQADRIVGHDGDDRIEGGGGDDTLVGGDGQDLLAGGDGDDLIRARDGDLDTIDCGPGEDVAVVDRAEDGVYDCEHVRIPNPSRKR